MSAVLHTRSGLRTLAVADLDAVLAVEASAYGFPWTRGNFIDSLAAAHWAEWRAGEDGDIEAYYVAMPALDEVHLLNLTVAPPLQGRGLAQGLLDRLQDRCRIAAMSRILLEVRASNERAQRLYRRRGFQVIGLRKGYYPQAPGRREDAIVMSLSLQSGAISALD